LAKQQQQQQQQQQHHRHHHHQQQQQQQEQKRMFCHEAVSKISVEFMFPSGPSPPTTTTFFLRMLFHEPLTRPHT
jgi:hypothetical protein